MAELLAAYTDHLAAYTRDAAKAKQLIAVGETKPDAKLESERAGGVDDDGQSAAESG